MFGMESNPVLLMLFLAGLTLAPFLAVMLTSYMKLTIVLQLLRSAMGLPQVPSNLVLNGLSIILTFFIMAPVFNALWDEIKTTPLESLDSVESVATVYDKAKEPVRQFLLKYASIDARTFFYRAAKKLWPKSRTTDLSKDDLAIVIPSFVVSEVKRAFEIGLLLYLPFIVLDLVVANILMAMGMMMVQPSTISLPFKLLLFVSIDGWTKVTKGLILSYG